MNRTSLKSSSRQELYSIIKGYEKQVRELDKKLAHSKEMLSAQRAETGRAKRSLKAKKSAPAGRPRNEELSRTRMEHIGKLFAEKLLSERIADSHNIVVNDIGKLMLIISDFSTRTSVPVRGLGILAFVRNFKSVRRKMLYDTGLVSGSWYTPVLRSLVKSGMLEIGSRLKQVHEYSLTDKGRVIVDKLISEVEECINVKETKGIET
jgi:predicted transcriptional regulator